MSYGSIKKNQANYVLVLSKVINKRQRIPKGQSKTENPEKLATQGTQDKTN